MPLALTDEEIDALIAISAPVPHELRDPFLRALALQLEKFPEIGPGLIHRLGREPQREFRRPGVAIGTRSRKLPRASRGDCGLLPLRFPSTILGSGKFHKHR
jgi:hypothetical protein